ncbi:MAG: glutaredoxin family protein [Trebonia sp.]
MYTTPWCGFCKNLKRQLARVGVEINEIDIERDPEAATFVEGVNGGNQTVPRPSPPGLLPAYWRSD